jgi:hypothetical protein
MLNGLRQLLAAIVGIGGGILGVILTPVLAAPILGLFGFGAAGPVAGKPNPVDPSDIQYPPKKPNLPQ